MKDLAFVRFAQPLWRNLTENDKHDLLNNAATQIASYYCRVEAKTTGA